jgi:hypothetical protein
LLKHARAINYFNINLAKSLQPNLRFRWSTTPDLPARRGIIVNYPDSQPTLRRAPRRRHPSRPRANYQHIANLIHRSSCSQKAQKNKAHIKSLFSSLLCLLCFTYFALPALLCAFCDLPCAFCDLSVGQHVHPVSTNRLTTTTMLFAVYRDATLKTDPHSTQWTTRLTGHRASKRIRACLKNRSGHHAARRHLD